MATWHLYLVRCADDTLYTGIALDVASRLALHKAGRGAKYLRGRGPLALARKWRVGTKNRALRLEHRVRHLTKPRKEQLAAGRLTLRQIELPKGT